MRHDRYFSIRLASARLGWRLSHFAIVHWCHSCYPQRRYHPLPSLAIVWLCCVKYTITCCWKKSEVSALFLVLPKASSRVFVIFFSAEFPPILLWKMIMQCLHTIHCTLCIMVSLFVHKMPWLAPFSTMVVSVARSIAKTGFAGIIFQRFSSLDRWMYSPLIVC